jgi:hypothetical protein
MFFFPTSPLGNLTCHLYHPITAWMNVCDFTHFSCEPLSCLLLEKVPFSMIILGLLHFDHCYSSFTPLTICMRYCIISCTCCYLDNLFLWLNHKCGSSLNVCEPPTMKCRSERGKARWIAGNWSQQPGFQTWFYLCDQVVAFLQGQQSFVSNCTNDAKLVLPLLPSLPPCGTHEGVKCPWIPLFDKSAQTLS